MFYAYIININHYKDKLYKNNIAKLKNDLNTSFETGKTTEQSSTLHEMWSEIEKKKQPSLGSSWNRFRKKLKSFPARETFEDSGAAKLSEKENEKKISLRNWNLPNYALRIKSSK